MKKKNVIIAAFLSLTVVSICSVTMTLAWFNYGVNLEVGHLNITLDGDKELLIGLNDKKFKESISFDDFQGTDSFIPVSSMYSYKWLDKKAELPILKAAYQRPSIANEATYKETVDADTGFFQREIYLKCNRDVIATIDSKDFQVIPNDVENAKQAKVIKEAYPERDEKEIIDSLNKVAKAMRISILDPEIATYDYTIIDPYKTGDTYLCGTLSLHQGQYNSYYLDETDHTEKEFLFGEYQNKDKIVYKEALEVDSSLKDPNAPYSVFNAKTRAGVKAIDFTNSIKDEGIQPGIEKSYTPDDASEKIAIPLKRNEPKKVIVTMYLEGWDLDNISESITGSFLANMAFKIKEG